MCDHHRTNRRDGLGIVFDCKEDAPASSVIKCRPYGAPRGTLGELRLLFFQARIACSKFESADQDGTDNKSNMLDFVIHAIRVDLLLLDPSRPAIARSARKPYQGADLQLFSVPFSNPAQARCAVFCFRH